MTPPRLCPHHVREGAVEGLDGRVAVGPGDDQRRVDPQDIGVQAALADDQAPGLGGVQHPRRQVGRGLLRGPVADQLHRDQHKALCWISPVSMTRPSILTIVQYRISYTYGSLVRIVLDRYLGAS